MDGGVEEVGIQARLEKEALEGASRIGKPTAGDKKKFSEELIREQVSSGLSIYIFSFGGGVGREKVRGVKVRREGRRS